MSGYPPSGQGYQHGAPNPYASAPPYGTPSAPSAPYGAPPAGGKPHKEGKDKYGGGSGAGYYGAPQPGYGAPPSAPYGGPAPPSGAPTPQGYGAPPPQGYGPPPPQGYGAPPSGAYGAPGGYGMSPFAPLLPSQFAPGTDPNVIACFQAADRYELPLILMLYIMDPDGI